MAVALVFCCESCQALTGRPSHSSRLTYPLSSCTSGFEPISCASDWRVGAAHMSLKPSRTSCFHVVELTCASAFRR
jgi:hypothetical protein